MRIEAEIGDAIARLDAVAARAEASRSQRSANSPIGEAVLPGDDAFFRAIKSTAR